MAPRTHNSAAGPLRRAAHTSCIWMCGMCVCIHVMRMHPRLCGYCRLWGVSAGIGKHHQDANFHLKPNGTWAFQDDKGNRVPPKGNGGVHEI